MAKTSAAHEFNRLNGMRRAFLTRCEKYSKLTLPRLCPEDGYDQNNTELSYDYQSVGAQASNHLANKMVLTLFAPSRPFIRLELSAREAALMAQQGMPQEEIDKALAAGERKAVKEMERRPVRTKLFECLLHLIVTGNALLYLPHGKDEEARVFGIKEYVVRRTGDGRVKRLIVKECLKFDELEQGVQDAYIAKTGRGHGKTAETEVHLYRDIELRQGRMYQETWVDSTHIGGKFDGSWSIEDCPWSVQTWNLSDRSDYGTGHVEDYQGAFAALSALSEAQVQGAILASEFRWLCNPAGITKPEDVENSENGAVLPGSDGDLSLIANSKAQDLQVVQSIHADYVRQIGYGFLLNSAVQRDAERVTAAEIRQQAMELETALGGVYTRQSLGLQKPVALWLLRSVDLKINNTKIELFIVTGLDALSRNGDLDALRSALQDIAALNTLGEALLATLELDQISTTIFLGHGLQADKFVKSKQKRADEQAAAQEGQRQQVVEEAAAKAAANNQGNQ